MKTYILILSLFSAVLIVEAQQDNNTILCNTVQFDGLDDYLQTDTVVVYQTSSFTIEYWVKIDSFLSTFTFFPSTYIAAEKGTRVCWYNYSTNTIRISFYNTAFSNAEATIDLDTNVWYHMAYTLDEADSTYRLFINGEMIIEQYFNNIEISSDPTMFLMGARPMNLSTVIDAELDEVRYWNYARTQSDIQNNMNSSVDPSTTGLIGYWNMDEENNDRATDLSNSDKPALLYNADISEVWTDHCINTMIDKRDVQQSMIYPIPADKSVYVNVSEGTTVQLFNIAGKQVLLEANRNGSSNLILNVSNLKNGIYLLRIGESTQKLIVKH